MKVGDPRYENHTRKGGLNPQTDGVGRHHPGGGCLRPIWAVCFRAALQRHQFLSLRGAVISLAEASSLKGPKGLFGPKSQAENPKDSTGNL